MSRRSSAAVTRNVLETYREGGHEAAVTELRLGQGRAKMAEVRAMAGSVPDPVDSVLLAVMGPHRCCQQEEMVANAVD